MLIGGLLGTLAGFTLLIAILLNFAVEGGGGSTYFHIGPLLVFSQEAGTNPRTVDLSLGAGALALLASAGLVGFVGFGLLASLIDRVLKVIR